MTPDTPLTPAEDDEALAAELALGLLEGDVAEAATARLSQDPGFARAVRGWQERLAGLAEGLTPVMAPARARQAIRERLGHARAPLTIDPNARRPWWRGFAGLLTGLVAVAAAVALLWLPGQPGPEAPLAPGAPVYQAQLSGTDAVLQAAAWIEGREVRIALESGAAPEGRDWEVWWIGSEDATPVSMGVMPRDGEMRMTLPEGMEPSPAVRLALSDEPAGGSPTGQATGPVMAIASLTAL